MWAALLSRRGLGLTVLMVLVVLACLRLGGWQWSRAQPDPLPPSPSPVPLASVTTPRTPFLQEDVGRRVEVSGRYLPRSELVVVRRDPAGSDTGSGQGVWALSALRTDSGAVLPVVRGWAADPASIPDPPRGPQTLQGLLQPSEDSGAAPQTVDGVLADDEVTTVSSAVLVGLYPTDQVYDGFLLLEPPSPGLRAVDPDVVPTSAWHLVNTGYALQWWVFAGFAVFMWVRLLRDQVDDTNRAADETTDRPDSTDSTDGHDRTTKELA